MTTQRKNQAAPMPQATGQTIGALIAPLAGTIMITAVEFGANITASQQAAITNLIMTTWAFGSTAYGLWHASRTRTTRRATPPDTEQ